MQRPRPQWERDESGLLLPRGARRGICDFTMGPPLLAGGASVPATDPYFANVKSLLHFDGTNGSTTFTDVIGNTWTASVATISTTSPKFGTGSGLFGPGTLISTTYSTTNFDWWTTSYTIEAWVKPNTLTNWSYNSSGSIPVLCGNMTFNSLTDYWSFGPNSSGQVMFYYYNGAQNRVTSTATLSTGVWTHVAMVNDAGTIRFFVGGTASGSAAISGTPQSSSGVTMLIGQGNNTNIDGNVDDFRITKGTARYTANFTPPTSAFPNS